MQPRGGIVQNIAGPDEAVEPLRRAIELRPDFAVAHNNLGLRFLGYLAKPDEALAHFRWRGAAGNPPSPPCA